MKHGFAANIRAQAEEDLTQKLNDLLQSSADTLTREFTDILEGQVLKDACELIENDLQEKLLKVPGVVKALLDEADKDADREAKY